MCHDVNSSIALATRGKAGVIVPRPVPALDGPLASQAIRVSEEVGLGLDPTGRPPGLVYDGDGSRLEACLLLEAIEDRRKVVGDFMDFAHDPVETV